MAWSGIEDGHSLEDVMLGCDDFGTVYAVRDRGMVYSRS